ncbi:MAG: flavodoxin family protein [Candidatus Manganitrophaceae bacterium]|nr:MAG: flavodoxin family protein [Candidatus Manganitrophaceae bacterium]
MAKRIVIIQGHPDPQGNHFGHALANAYAEEADEAGHEIKRIDVARLDFPLLRSQEEFERGAPPEAIREAQEAIRWADHLVIFFPLWLGTMPAFLKGFLEQLFRPGFAMAYPEGKMPKKLLKGKSARIVVTMGMPAFFYRWYFHAHGVKGLEQSVLRFSGIRPIRETFIGRVEGSSAGREKSLAKLRTLGRQGR